MTGQGDAGNGASAPRDIIAEVMSAPSEGFTGAPFEVNVGKEVMCAVLEDTIDALTTNASMDATDRERAQRNEAIRTLSKRLAWAEGQAVINFWVEMRIDE